MYGKSAVVTQDILVFCLSICVLVLLLALGYYVDGLIFLGGVCYGVGIGIGIERSGR